MFVDHENYRIQLLVVIFHKLEQNWKSDDAAVHKLCSHRYKVQALKLNTIVI